jgi:hypothetical protein
MMVLVAPADEPCEEGVHPGRIGAGEQHDELADDEKDESGDAPDEGDDEVQDERQDLDAEQDVEQRPQAGALRRPLDGDVGGICRGDRSTHGRPPRRTCSRAPLHATGSRRRRAARPQPYRHGKPIADATVVWGPSDGLRSGATRSFDGRLRERAPSITCRRTGDVDARSMERPEGWSKQRVTGAMSELGRQS